MSIREKERRSQSTVWYLALPLFEKYNMKLPKRKSFTGKIKEVCEKLGTTREEKGIIAKARATMYFSGVKTDVSYDAINALAENGTDIIFIEKEAIVEVLCEYAYSSGIALVDTQGFFTDYGRDLVETGEASGANIAVVSDYDASGMKLAHDAGDIPRLGVDQEMLDYFGLNRESKTLSAPAKAAKNVINPIKDLVSADVLEFLKRRKVEIDAVLAHVGPERFWEYLINKLQEYYPKRDYTRVISTSPDLSNYYPEASKDIERCIKEYVDAIVADEEEKIETELEEFEGIIDDVPEKRNEIDKRLGAIVENDEHLKELDGRLAEIKPILDNLAILTKEKQEQHKKEDIDKGGKEEPEFKGN
jgi:hypothetical protein